MHNSTFYRRDVRPPAKDLIKLFIRSFGLRFGANGLGPWVVSEEYVKKYSLPSKYADFLLSPSKVRRYCGRGDSLLDWHAHVCYSEGTVYLLPSVSLNATMTA